MNKDNKKKEQLSFEHLFTDQLKEEYNKKEGNTKRIYAVMEFNTEFNLGISNTPYKWTVENTTITTNGMQALHKYIYNSNPITKLIDAESFEELNQKMINITNKFKNTNYINKEIEYYY